MMNRTVAHHPAARRYAGGVVRCSWARPKPPQLCATVPASPSPTTEPQSKCHHRVSAMNVADGMAMGAIIIAPSSVGYDCRPRRLRHLSRAAQLCTCHTPPPPHSVRCAAAAGPLGMKDGRACGLRARPAEDCHASRPSATWPHTSWRGAGPGRCVTRDAQSMSDVMATLGQRRHCFSSFASSHATH